MKSNGSRLSFGVRLVDNLYFRMKMIRKTNQILDLKKMNGTTELIVEDQNLKQNDKIRIRKNWIKKLED